jgi:hypothetical protein
VSPEELKIGMVKMLEQGKDWRKRNKNKTRNKVVGGLRRPLTLMID